MAVLILATTSDPHATAVAAEIEQLGAEARILDLSLFPQHARLSARYECCTDCGGRSFALELDSETLQLGDFGAVWWRRPQTPQVSPDIVRPTHRMFAANEAQEALAGLWPSLDAYWVNNPSCDTVAHRKAYQLSVAQDTGLRIPHTLITNDPGSARSFADSYRYRDVVYKAFSATEAEWRETRLLQEDELALLDNVRYTPLIFQEYIEADYDLRVTMVGGAVFGAAIDSQHTSYAVDFRMDIANARIEPVDLPAGVVDGLTRLMERLGLVYGAIDMRRTPEGEHVFLEINPAGQWLFIEERSGQPISAALARELVAHDRTTVA
jgi:glutathione synthase/RimK-type ligase-like ATP-grasp enzyme